MRTNKQLTICKSLEDGTFLCHIEYTYTDLLGYSKPENFYKFLTIEQINTCRVDGYRISGKLPLEDPRRP